MDIKELKAKAYDILVEIQFLQNELGKINKQIAEEKAKPKDTVDNTT